MIARYRLPILIGLVALVFGTVWVLDAPQPRSYAPQDPPAGPLGPFVECLPPEKVAPKGLEAAGPRGPDSPSCLAAVGEAQRNELELEAQWRAAVAATNAVALAERQWRSSLLEFAALLGTLAIAYVAIVDGRKHTTAELRAYLAIKERVLSHFFVGQQARVAFRISNAGSTPAYNMRYRAALEVFACPYNGDIMREFAKDPNEIAPAFVVQSQEFAEAEAIQHRPLTQEDYDAIMRGSKALYFVGEVDYDDAFGHPRITEFCCWVGGPEFAEADKAARQRKAPTSRVDWIYTRLHNVAT